MSVNKFFKWFVILALIISLVITGINSNMLGGNDDNIVANVGKQKISVEEYLKEYKNHSYYIQSMFNFGLSEKQLKEFGLPGMVLNQLVQEKVLLELFRKINFHIGDKATIESIKNNQNFHTDNKFDRKKLDTFLSNASLTEENYIKKVKFDISRDIIFSLFFNMPGSYYDLAKRFYNFQYQIRSIAITQVDSETNITIKEPEENELKDFYEKNKELFHTQEYRTAQYLILSDDNVKPDLIKVNEDDVLAKFNELDLSKLFDIDYIEFSSKQDAEKVKNSISSHPEYYQNDILHLTHKFKYELPEAFHKELKWDGNKWKLHEHESKFYLIKIVNVDKISDEEKQNKLNEIRKFLTIQKLDDITEVIEKDLLEIKDMGKIATKYGLLFKQVEPISKNSRDKNGEIVEIHTFTLKNIFEIEKNKLSAFIPMGDEYINIYVTDIEEERTLNFDEAKKEVTELLKDKIRSEELAKTAINNALKEKNPINIIDIYRENIKAEKNPEQDFPEEFTNEMFNLDIGQVSKAFRYKDSFIVGKVMDIKNPEDNDLIIKKIESKIQEEISLSLITELTEHYTKEFNVKINDKVLKGLL